MWNQLSDQEKIRLTVLNDEYEIDSIDQGAARFRREQEGRDVKAAHKTILANTVMEFAEIIRQKQQDILSGKAMRGRPAVWGNDFILLDPLKVSLITLNTILSSEQRAITNISFEIADRLKTEFEFDRVLEANRKRDFEQKGFSVERGNRHSTRKDTKRLYEMLHDGKLKWSNAIRLKMGAALVEMAQEMQGLFVKECRALEGDKNSRYYIEPSEELAAYIVNKNDDMSILHPIRNPMCCPPLPWEGEQGGYRIASTRRVRDRFDMLSQPTRESDNLSMVALNAIQAVEWKIDTETVSLIDAILRINSADYDDIVPSFSDRPNLPPYIEYADKLQRSAQYRSRQVIKDKWRKASYTRAKVMNVVRIAKQFKDKPVFFPHSMDWRGRVYPETTYLSPQGNDMQKALLLFSEGIPLGSNGLRELKIWAAGCAGNDKISFDDRVRWFDATYSPLTYDPYDDPNWTEYDSPLLFAQVMRDIKRAVASGNPSKYVSHVPCCLDGSQNGLQHLSAMGRDSVGGKEVNLLPSEIPADLYMEVAHYVFEKNVEDIDVARQSGNTIDRKGQPVPCIAVGAMNYNPKQQRKIVKRSVLAFPYGVTKRGMSSGMINDGLVQEIAGGNHDVAKYLADNITEAVQAVVINAALIMAWMQSEARKAAVEGKDLQWTTPLGVDVIQYYKKMQSCRIETCSGKLSIIEPTDTLEILAMKQVNGIVANFVHSLDAAHLMMVCLAMAELGVISMQFIHDSIGAHAGRIALLHQVIREQFIKMHETDHLAAFAKRNGITTTPPARGDLDLNQVLQSEYFFA